MRDNGRTVAACLRSVTGTSTLGVLGSIGKQSATLDLLDAGAAGLTSLGELRFGSLSSCPELATAGTTTVAAGVARGPGRVSTLQAVVMDNGAVAPAVSLGRAATSLPGLDFTPADIAPAVAVSSRGDALVAWPETSGDFLFDKGRRRVLVSRRLPGGAFGPAQVLVPWRAASSFETVLLDAAYDGAGNATVAWSRTPAKPRGRSLSRRVEVAQGAPGEPLRRTTIATSRRSDPETLDLAVAPDGHALLAYDGERNLQVAERSGPGAAFRSVRLEGMWAYGGYTPAVAVQAGGSGLVAWSTQATRDGDGAVLMATRTADGPFTRARLVYTARPSLLNSYSETTSSTRFGAPPDGGNRRLRAALGGDGRFSLVWTTRRRSIFGDVPYEAHGLSGSLGGAVGRAATLSCRCRAVNGVAALLADGEPAAAFTDNRSDGRFGLGESARAGGRTHLWLTSAARTRQPLPHVTIASPRRQLLRWNEPLRLRVRCSAACDLRGTVPNPRHRRSHLWRGLGTASLPRAGVTWLRIHPESLKKPLLPRSARHITVDVRTYARDGSDFTLRSLRVRARLRPLHPLRLPFAFRVRRAGRALVVTWRYPSAPANVAFVVDASGPRRAVSYRPRLFQFIGHNRRGRYRVVLRPRPRDHVSTVGLTTWQSGPPRERTLRLPIPP